MTVLVLGAGGFLGSNLVRALRVRSDVVAVSRGAERSATSAAFEEWPSALDRARARGPVAVVNTVAIADHAACERDPAACERVNHLLARDVAVTCAARDVPLIHISTDGLFGQGTVAEAPAYFDVADPTSAANAYARAKRAAERALERIGWGHVLRLSFVGSDNGTGRGLLRFLADRVRAGTSAIDGFSDNWFTPVHVDDVADAVFAHAAKGGFSLEHVASYPALTKYDFLRGVLAAGNEDLRVVPIERPAANSAPTPVDQSLGSARPVELQSVIERSAGDLRNLIAR
jgi:dTDP-4-dehydrorhamnose reductase